MLAQPSGFRPEVPDLFYQNNIKGWGPALCARRPDITMAMVDAFLSKMYRANADFVFTVTRDFVRACQTPVLVLPDDIPAHPYAVAMESRAAGAERPSEPLPLEGAQGPHSPGGAPHPHLPAGASTRRQLPAKAGDRPMTSQSSSPNCPRVMPLRLLRPSKVIPHHSGRTTMMAFVTTNDNVKLYYEETGAGAPIVFVHEFAGDHRSWEPQMRHFAQRHRCVAYSTRGAIRRRRCRRMSTRYSQAAPRDDIAAVLDHLKIDKAHVVGLSMGGFATLHFGLPYPERALSLVVAGAGYGAEEAQRERFRNEAVVIAGKLEKEGMAAFAENYAYGPTRVQFENKDPRGFAEFKRQLAEHSAKGAANTQLGVQRERPSIFDLEAQLERSPCRR